MMKELNIKNTYIFIFLFIFCELNLVFTQNTLEINLEKKNRIEIENYYFSGKDSGDYSIIFVYCNDGYYPLHNTTLSKEIVGHRRYFFDENIKTTGNKILTQTSDNKLSFLDFKKKYLVKKDNVDYYNVSDIIKHDLFASIELIDAILFTAQYNYDMLILCENRSINLYLPENYPNITFFDRGYKKTEENNNSFLICKL